MVEAGAGGHLLHHLAGHADLAAAILHLDFGQPGFAQHLGQFANQPGIHAHAGRFAGGALGGGHRRLPRNVYSPAPMRKAAGEGKAYGGFMTTLRSRFARFS